jgi:FdhD protein
MGDRSSTSVTIERVRHRATTVVRDVVAVEEPMEIRIVANGESHRVAVTMRTPGYDFDLAVGFLLSEGLIARREDVVDVSYCPDLDDVQQFNVVQVTLAPTTSFDLTMLDRNFYATSSCGVCGKGSLEALRTYCAVAGNDDLRVEESMIRGLPAKLRGDQRVFSETGGLHATGLFTNDGLLVTLREDVGRHNALDKVVGRHLMSGDLPLSRSMAVVSGRASWELMQKAAAAGIPMVVAIGAPSSLAINLAVEFGMTLAGFTREDGFNVYAGSHRIALR